MTFVNIYIQAFTCELFFQASPSAICSWLSDTSVVNQVIVSRLAAPDLSICKQSDNFGRLWIHLHTGRHPQAVAQTCDGAGGEELPYNAAI